MTVIIDAVSGRKRVLAHASLMPDVAILDAALTEGVPPHITAMTGIDALTHAVEAYSARHATPFTGKRRGVAGAVGPGRGGGRPSPLTTRRRRRKGEGRDRGGPRPLKKKKRI